MEQQDSVVDKGDVERVELCSYREAILVQMYLTLILQGFERTSVWKQSRNSPIFVFCPKSQVLILGQ